MLRTGADEKYVTQVRAVIDEKVNPESGPYGVADKAREVYEHLKEHNPDLLEGWLHEQAVQFIRTMISDRDRSYRAHVRASDLRRRSVFQEALTAYEAGDLDALPRWSETVYVIADGTRKRMAEMRGEELQYVADGYESRERQNRLMKSFLRAIAQRIGDGRVEDYFNDNQLRSMWASVGGNR